MNDLQLVVGAVLPLVGAVSAVRRFLAPHPMAIGGLSEQKEVQSRMGLEYLTAFLVCTVLLLVWDLGVLNPSPSREVLFFARLSGRMTVVFAHALLVGSVIAIPVAYGRTYAACSEGWLSEYLSRRVTIWGTQKARSAAIGVLSVVLVGVGAAVIYLCSQSVLVVSKESACYAQFGQVGSDCVSGQDVKKVVRFRRRGGVMGQLRETESVFLILRSDAHWDPYELSGSRVRELLGSLRQAFPGVPVEERDAVRVIGNTVLSGLD